MEKIEVVKKDLRRLRKLNHSIEVSMQVKERYEKRLAYLEEQDSYESVAEQENVQKTLETLGIDEFIKSANALESKYMKVINELPLLDRVIILDGYINGKSYWKVGADIGYSEDGIKKRMKKIIAQIAERI